MNESRPHAGLAPGSAKPHADGVDTPRNRRNGTGRGVGILQTLACEITVPVVRNRVPGSICAGSLPATTGEHRPPSFRSRRASVGAISTQPGPVHGHKGRFKPQRTDDTHLRNHSPGSPESGPPIDLRRLTSGDYTGNRGRRNPVVAERQSAPSLLNLAPFMDRKAGPKPGGLARGSRS